MEPGSSGSGADCRPRPRRRGPGQRPAPPLRAARRVVPWLRCVVQRLRCVAQGFRRDRTDDAGWHLLHRSKVEAQDHPRVVHPGNRPYYVLGLVMVRLERLGVPRGTVLDVDRVVTAAPLAPRCQRTRSVLPRPSGAGPARPTWGRRRRRRARQRQPPPVVRAALARALPDRAAAVVRLWVGPSASTSARAGPGVGYSGVSGSTGHSRPHRPGGRAWTRSCGPPGQQSRENVVRRFCPAGTALRAVGGARPSGLRCVRPPATGPQMRQGPERNDPLGALSGVLPAQRTSSRSWEPVVRASASWWWCAASSSAGVTGATRSSKKKRLIRSRVFSVAVILPFAFGWAGSTW